MSVMRRIVAAKAAKAAVDAIRGVEHSRDGSESEHEPREAERAQIVPAEPPRGRSLGMMAVGVVLGGAVSWLLASRRRPDTFGG